MATRNHNLSKFDSPLPSAADMRFGIVVAEWNREVTEALLEGAVRTLRAAGCPDMNIQIKYVPGTFELSLGAQFFAEYTDVEKTVNYLTVYQIVRERMGQTQRTIERVALNIIEALYAAFPQLRHVKCTVSKLAPPLGGKLDRVSVTLER